MDNREKRHPIRRRVMAVLLIISMSALAFTGLLWFGSIMVVRNQVAADSEELGDTAYEISALSMMAQMEKNYVATAENRAQTIDAILKQYLSYVADFAFYAHRLYEEPEAYQPKEVSPPDAVNKYKYIMQLNYVSETIDKAALADEIGLLANCVHIWQPVMESPDSQIASIYLCTESGFAINYDERSDLTPEYWDFYENDWYISARDQRETILTGVYSDSFGRGQMVTCAAPFYDAAGDFAGVMCIDLLLSDLEQVLSDVELGDGSFLYLVDGAGKILLSPKGDISGVTEEERKSHKIGDLILEGKSGGQYGGSDNGMFFAYSPVKSGGWMLIFQVPSELIKGPSTEAVTAIEEKTESTIAGIRRSIWIALLLNLAVIVIVYIVVAVIGRVFSKQLTDPLLELREDVAIISGGNLEHRAEIRRADEIGDLARSFNFMAKSLDEHIQSLTRVTAERERIGAELDVAKHIQASMLPCIFPPYPDRREFEIYASMNPAKEVGGDFYDFFMVDESHLAIVMADVSGKGVPAALFMVIGKTLIKDHTEPGADLGEVFGEVNDMLCASNSEGLFITAFEGVLDLVTGEFRFVNAGHEMPFLSKGGGAFKPYKIRPGFVLAGMEGMRYRSGSLMLEPGDMIFQYTDGVTEATDRDKQLYGMERLESVLSENAAHRPQEIIEAVAEDINRFVGEAEQFDDITMLALAYKERMIQS